MNDFTDGGVSNCQLIHGDCLSEMRKMSSDSAHLIITSPPYLNQASYSHWSTYDAYMEFIREVVAECARVLKPGRHCFWVIPDKIPFPPAENGTGERMYLPVYADTEAAARAAGLECEFPIIWKKPHGAQKMFGCLGEATLINMADGSQKFIPDIVVGDQVLAFDGQRIVPDKVTHIHKKTSIVYRVLTRQGQLIITPDHKVLTALHNSMINPGARSMDRKPHWRPIRWMWPYHDIIFVPADFRSWGRNVQHSRKLLYRAGETDMVIALITRIEKPSHKIVVPVYDLTTEKHHNFLAGGHIVHNSYPYPPTTIHTPMTERICVWRKRGKPTVDRERKRASRYSKEQWVSYAQDLWEIAPESSVKHPAPFPLEIPRRILTLWSMVGDLVLDPFLGSGTTAVAALALGRNFVGMDIHAEYVNLARQRVAGVQMRLEEGSLA